MRTLILRAAIGLLFIGMALANYGASLRGVILANGPEGPPIGGP